MKKIILLFALLANGTLYAQQPPPAKKQTEKLVQKTTNKYNDDVDDRMKGPKGEKIYIGPNGGRYYLSNGKKVYVAYKGKKKKTT